jgi:polysaccharide export outer membrane protein
LQYYKKVSVTATLLHVRTVKVQILGEVKNPGEYELSGITGALEAIQFAGGLTDKASVRNILLEENGKPVQTLDYFKWKVFGDETQDPYLAPNEVIFVPVAKDVVFFGGEVKHPGVYEMLPGETYSDLIQMAGGFSSHAMPNQATLSRIAPGGKLVKISLSPHLALQNGDSIQVPSLDLFQSKIRVIGELVGAETFPQITNNVTGAHSVERVGWYYLRKNETVKDVVIDMGGFTPQADPSHAWVERIEPNGKKKIIKLDLHRIFLSKNSKENIVLKDGDTLFVPPSPNSIYVLGEVKSGGVFPYTPGNGIQDYVALAGGPTPQGKTNHVMLVRFQPGNKKPEVYDVNLEGYLTGKIVNLPMLKPGDVIYVPRSVFAHIQDVLGFLGNIFLLKTFIR